MFIVITLYGCYYAYIITILCHRNKREPDYFRLKPKVVGTSSSLIKENELRSSGGR
jgi:hypothetical protein